MAYEVTVFESADELFDAFEDGRISTGVYLVHENEGRTPPRLSIRSGGGVDAETLQKFSLELLSWDNILTELLDRVNIDVHFT